MASRVTFERAVGALNEAMLDDARWAHASSLIDEACGARGSLLVYGADREPGKVEIYFAKCFYRGDDRSDWWQEWYRHYYPTDEHLVRMRLLPDSKIAPVADLFSETELKASRTYNEGLPRFVMQDGLRVRLDGPGGSRIVWAIGDPVDANGWSSSRVDTVARVLEHVRQYVRVRSALVKAGALGASLVEMLSNARLGVIQLDRRGRIVEVNDVARRLLRRSECLFDTNRTLVAASRDEDTRLQRALNGALSPGSGQVASRSLSVSNAGTNLPVSLHVAPVPERSDRFPGAKVGAVVLIADPASQARVEPEVVAETLELTPAEAEIAVLLASGRTPREIAARTGRTYNTVRTHLKQMFTKLGVTRQLDVARAVGALASLPRPRD
ncbi:MAG: hypothetical protein F4X59_11975 [Holophagales bacterium]|nr:hypothetical protein [Holophagales bacterium]MYC10833.1 hypothetical protein [Holophagales bacterium]